MVRTSSFKPQIAWDNLQKQNPVLRQYALILRHSVLSRASAEGEHVHHTESPVIAMKCGTGRSHVDLRDSLGVLLL